MITGIVGGLGGGKSYYAARRIGYALARGEMVATNIGVKIDAIAADLRRRPEDLQRHLVMLDPDDQADPWEWPRGTPRGRQGPRVGIWIDEAAEWMSFDGDKTSERKFRSWMRQSDKRGQDVNLIVQDPSMLMRQGRVIVHVWVRVQDMSKWRMPGIGLPLPPPWSREFRYTKFSQDGKTVIRKWYEIRDTRVYKWYDTAEMYGTSHDAAAGGNAASAQLLAAGHHTTQHYSSGGAARIRAASAASIAAISIYRLLCALIR